MVLKDWILLIVPILCNGVIVFILEKIFEKRQTVHAIKLDYANNLRQKIDTALYLHTKALQLNQSVNSDIRAVSKILSEFIDASADVFYYYGQDKSVFNCLESIMEKLATDIQNAVDYIRGSNIIESEYFSLIQNIRNTLLQAKEKCIKI